MTMPKSENLTEGTIAVRGLGTGVSSLLSWVPAPLYVVAAILLIQFASATAKEMITPSTLMGLVFLRALFGAILATLFIRPNVRSMSRRQWIDAAGLGFVMAVFASLIYLALNYLPLGLVVTIGFLGPLSVSLFGARRILDAFWPILGFIGVLLLAPLDGASAQVSVIGLVCAGLYAVSWALYILMSARSGRSIPGFVGFCLALWFCALFSAPLGLIHVGGYLSSWDGVMDVLLITMLTTLPFALEFLALKRLSPAVFGVLLSSEPAIAALVGLGVLGEELPVAGWSAIGLVTIAAFGASWFSSARKK